MKRLIEGVENAIIWTGRSLLGAFLLILALVCGVILLFKGSELSWFVREYNYYKDPTQFVELTAEAAHIYWDTSYLLIGLEEIPEGFSERTFVIEGENLRVVQENGLKEQLQEGQTVTFISAPRYFGDGYVMPIVGLSIDGEVYLDFDVGHTGLMEQYRPLG